MRQTINLSRIYSPLHAGSDNNQEDGSSESPFHELQDEQRYSEPAARRATAEDGMAESVDILNDELDLEQGKNCSKTLPRSINEGAKELKLPAAAPVEDSTRPFPSAPDLSHQVSVFDFVRSALQPPRSSKPCSFHFSIRNRMLVLLVLLGAVAGTMDLLIREYVLLLYYLVWEVI